MVSQYEQESILLFNEAEATASCYTYNRSWQRHLEEKLGLKPVANDGQGGKTYEFPKKWLRKPQKPREVSPDERERRRKQLSEMLVRRVANLSTKRMEHSPNGEEITNSV